MKVRSGTEKSMNGRKDEQMGESVSEGGVSE